MVHHRFVTFQHQLLTSEKDLSSLRVPTFLSEGDGGTASDADGSPRSGAGTRHGFLDQRQNV